MRKNINKLATLVMTGALAATMSFSAFAETQQPALVGSGDTMTVIKKVATDGKTYAPNGSFSFSVVPGTITDKETKEFAVEGNAKKTYDIKQGPEGSVSEVTKATFAPDAIATDYETTFTVKFDKTKFATAGVYKYKLTENDKFYTGQTESTKDYPGMVYDNAEYTMYVFVVNDAAGTGREVKNVVIMNAAGSKVNVLTNHYGKDDPNTPDDDDKVFDLTISKKVEGSLANMSEKFKFDVQIVSDVAGEKFSVYKVTKENNEEVETLSQTIVGGGAAVTLDQIENGTTYRIYGLTAGDKVSVKEQEANSNGYVTTYVTDATDVSESTKGTLDSSSDAASVNVTANGATLTITNKREAVTPTGVAMDVAPYALMVALAGGAAATFLRKKESFED